MRQRYKTRQRSDSIVRTVVKPFYNGSRKMGGWDLLSNVTVGQNAYDLLIGFHNNCMSLSCTVSEKCRKIYLASASVSIFKKVFGVSKLVLLDCSTAFIA